MLCEFKFEFGEMLEFFQVWVLNLGEYTFFYEHMKFPDQARLCLAISDFESQFLLSQLDYKSVYDKQCWNYEFDVILVITGK